LNETGLSQDARLAAFGVFYGQLGAADKQAQGVSNEFGAASTLDREREPGARITPRTRIGRVKPPARLAHGCWDVRRTAPAAHGQFRMASK
jgi:hypothetical protein